MNRETPTIPISSLQEGEIIAWISAQFRRVVLPTVTLSHRESCFSDVLISRQPYFLNRTSFLTPRYSGFQKELINEEFASTDSGSAMHVIAIIQDYDEIIKILQHLVKQGRAPPGVDAASFN